MKTDFITVTSRASKDDERRFINKKFIAVVEKCDMPGTKSLVVLIDGSRWYCKENVSDIMRQFTSEPDRLEEKFESPDP